MSLAEKYKYPRELSAIVEHSRRLAIVLAEMETDLPESTSLHSRHVQLRIFVASVLKEFRKGPRGLPEVEKACEVLGGFLDSMHREAGRRLGQRPKFECCRTRSAITADSHELKGAPYEPHVTTGRDAPRDTESWSWEDVPEFFVLMKAGEPILEACARTVERHVPDTITSGDIRQFGREGLIEAARSFDEARGKSFESWAWIRVRRSMIQGVRKWLEDSRQQATRGQSPATASPRAPRGGLIAESNPEDEVAHAELLERLRIALELLPEKERTLVERHHFAGEPLKDVAAALGISKWWGSRLYTRAMAALRRALEVPGVTALDTAVETSE